MAYLTIAVFAIAGVAFIGIALALSRLLRPSAPTPAKLETYECGPAPIGEAWQQFNMHYYLYALLFVVFDVEAAFLYPWALAFRSVGAYAVAEMIVFVGLLGVGLVYAWGRGALEWE
jgi:NADH-quinone oxidoreductase subunit A